MENGYGNSEHGLVGLPESFNVAHLRYRCAECGIDGEEDLLLCGRCGKIKYCGPECQAKAWKRVHKHVCKTPDQLGFLTVDKIKSASFRQLAFVLDEWCRCCTSLIGVVATALVNHVIGGGVAIANANPNDVAYTAKKIASYLDGNTNEMVVCQLILAASCLVMATSDAADEAIRSTPLLPVTIDHFLRSAPRFGDCEFNGTPSVKSVEPIRGLVTLLTNQLSGGSCAIDSKVSLQKCADLASTAIVDCASTIYRPPVIEGSQFKQAPKMIQLARCCRAAYGRELQDFSV